jgi:hypothetical protein
MSAAREPNSRSARVRAAWRGGVVLAALAIATFAAVAEAKVIWDGSTPVTPHHRDGAREGCRSRPLIRAERLARHESFVVQRFHAPFIPSLFMPYPLWVPAFQTGWLWSGDAGIAFVRRCDGD